MATVEQRVDVKCLVDVAPLVDKSFFISRSVEIILTTVPADGTTTTAGSYHYCSSPLWRNLVIVTIKIIAANLTTRQVHTTKATTLAVANCKIMTWSLMKMINLCIIDDGSHWP